MSQPRLACWSALAVCLTTGAAAAAEKPKVVVLPMEGSTESLVRIGSSISEQILTELGRTELVEAMGSSDVQLLLGMERQKTLLGCSEASNSCLAEMSSALGAPWVVTGSLAQFGKTTRLDIKLIRAKDGKAIFRDGVNFKDESDLFELVTAIVKRMVPKMDLKTAPATAPTPVVVAPKPKPEPVVVQQPEPRPAPIEAVTVEPKPVRVAPIVMMSAGGAAAVGGAVLLVAGKGLRETTMTSLASTVTDPPPPTYDVAYRQLGTADTAMLVGGIVGGMGVAALATGIVWLITGRESQQPMVSIGPGSVVVQGSF